MAYLVRRPSSWRRATDALLRETDSAYKDITVRLYVEYTKLREQLIAFLTGAANGAKLPMAAAIEVAQKTLDRILFVAFAGAHRPLAGQAYPTRRKCA